MEMSRLGLPGLYVVPTHERARELERLYPHLKNGLVSIAELGHLERIWPSWPIAIRYAIFDDVDPFTSRFLFDRVCDQLNAREGLTQVFLFR